MTLLKKAGEDARHGKTAATCVFPSIVITKEAMDRPKDREVVLQLKAIREKLG